MNSLIFVLALLFSAVLVWRVTARTRRELAQLKREASVFRNSYKGALICDSNNVITDLNPAFTRITGYQPDDVIGKNPRVLASGRQGSDFYSAMWTSLHEHGHWHGEIWNRRKDGDVYAEMLSISVVRDQADKVQHYIAIFSDISSLKQHEAELNHIAHYDILTDVPNRRLLSSRVDQAIARSRHTNKAVAVCYLDLDGFKPINDQYGHKLGDLLLIEVAARLKELLRADDTVARFGGDEFILLLNDLSGPHDYRPILDRVLGAIRQPILIDGVSLSLSASIGVTLCPPDRPDTDILLRHSDQAMYAAKQAGRNRYHLFDPDQDRQIQAHCDKLERLGLALDQHEFVLHYQPKVDLVRREVIGVEALIRWQHPEEGLLPPIAFLPDILGTHLESRVGEWVIESTLRQMAAWEATGQLLAVSINISPAHLLQPDFTRRLGAALERHPGVKRENLELEIVETSAFSDMKRAAQALAGCQELGVRVALDDFGTGYSSLSYFRNLPVNVLKIDRSFVQDMLDDPNDLDIVESVVSLAQAFNRQVVAEGVETMEHGEMLVLLGCPCCQGFGLAQPMPGEQVADWAAQWSAQADGLRLDPNISHEDFPLLVTARSHRKCIQHLAQHLDEVDGQALTGFDALRSRFGRWYQGSGARRYGILPEFQAIAPIHERVHHVATELIELARSGKTKHAHERLPELHLASEQFLKHVEALFTKGSPSAGLTPSDQRSGSLHALPA